MQIITTIPVSHLWKGSSTVDRSEQWSLENWILKKLEFLVLSKRVEETGRIAWADPISRTKSLSGSPPGLGYILPSSTKWVKQQE